MTGWHHAPPPGSRSGVADYAEALQKGLSVYGVPPVDLYHLGNNRLHADIYRQALEKPGVIVLHDAVLHHFLLGELTRERYLEEFVYNYGEWRRHLAEELWAERGSSGVDSRYFRFPMLKRIVECSRAVIVHNAGAAAIVRQHGSPDTRIEIIPHFFAQEDAPDAADIVRFRDEIGVGQGTTLFGIFGFLRETKRVLPCIGAFLRLHEVRPDTALLLAGDPVSTDLSRLLVTEAAHEGIYRMGHLPERDLRTAAGAIDCCLNLRYPHAGETSGIAIRMMGAGKPVIVTAGDEYADIPATACLRVSHGIAEPAELFDHMAMVAVFPGIAKDIGMQGRRHIVVHHSLEAAAAAYWKVLSG